MVDVSHSSLVIPYSLTDSISLAIKADGGVSTAAPLLLDACATSPPTSVALSR